MLTVALLGASRPWLADRAPEDPRELAPRPSLFYNQLFVIARGAARRSGARERAVALFAVSFWSHLLNILIILVGLFLILVVLIQRGKGGGLAAGFGGAGGSSAFGTRAGDTFTRITIGVAAVWVLLLMFQAKMVQGEGGATQDQGNTFDLGN